MQQAGSCMNPAHPSLPVLDPLVESRVHDENHQSEPNRQSDTVCFPSHRGGGRPEGGSREKQITPHKF